MRIVRQPADTSAKDGIRSQIKREYGLFSFDEQDRRINPKIMQAMITELRNLR